MEIIGLAGLVTPAVIRLRPGVRALFGILLLMIYQLLRDRFLLERTVHWPMGGLIGSLSWAGMPILATVFAHLYHEPRPGLILVLVASLLALAAGLCLASWLPVSQHRVSLTYVLTGLGVSGLIFALVDLVEGRYHFESRGLVACGRNAIALFILHYALIGVVYLPGIPVLYAGAPLGPDFLEAAFLVMGVIRITAWLEPRSIYITL